MNQKDIFQINVQEILNAKAPKQAKSIPKFLVRWLANLICQDRINEFLRYNGTATGVDLMNNAMEFFRFSLDIIGEENIPAFDRKCIFASNHPLGGVDGICLSSYLGNRYNQHIKYLVNDILYFIKPLQPIFVPINKHGAQNKNAAQLLNEALASNNQIITFPAGLNSRKNNGAIRDPEWKKMVIVKAVENQRDVVPIFFDAVNSNTFYNVAIWRKRLKIKFNIEMLFLPKEMIKKENSTLQIYFGKPIPWQTFDESKTPRQWAEWVKQIVYNMNKQ
jgi:Putative hemolysin